MERPDLSYVIREFQASVAVKQRILEDSRFMRASDRYGAPAHRPL